MLASAPAAPVALVVRDASGAELRRYSSTDTAPPTPLARIGYAPEWEERPVTLSATPGLHRFVWPLRLAPAAGLGGGAFGNGVWVPPGRYTVELIVDGTVLAQPLEVKPDPRVTLPDSAYAAQFATAKRVEAARARVAQASGPAAALQASITERTLQATGNERAILETIPGTARRGDRRPARGQHGGRLVEAGESADHAPLSRGDAAIAGAGRRRGGRGPLARCDGRARQGRGD